MKPTPVAQVCVAFVALCGHAAAQPPTDRCEAGPFTVVAAQTAHAGMGEQLRTLNTSVVAAMRREAAGLLLLDLYRHTDKPDEILLFEHWTSRSAWQAFHANRPPSVQPLFERYAGLWAGPAEVSTWCGIPVRTDN